MFFVCASMLVLLGSGYALATPLSLAVGEDAAAVAVPTCSGVGSMVVGCGWPLESVPRDG